MAKASTARTTPTSAATVAITKNDGGAIGR